MPRPDKQDSVVFDLVEDNGPGGAADAGTDATPSTGPSLLSRLPRPSRRTWVIAAAVVAAVAVTGASVDLARDHRRAELMRTSPVGVASLAAPPEETWTVPFDVPAGQGSGANLGQEIVVMDGLLVLPPTSPTDDPADPAIGMFRALPGFTDIVAVEPGTGETAWRVPVDESPMCGPTGYDASVSTEVLVCVQGPEDARQALAITPDGGARARDLDPAEDEQVFPGPDGTVVRAVRTGEPVACEAAEGCPTPTLDQGRDLRVTVEDAGTGAERWTTTLEFDPALSNSCQTWVQTGDEPSTEPVFDLELAFVYVTAESITVDGCGVSAALSVSGTRLDLAGDVASGQVWVSELGSGRFAVEGDGRETLVVNEDGEVLHTLDGWVRSGRTSPDAPDDLWFVTHPSGNGLAAVREDGSEAWTAPAGADLALVARDVVIVNRGNRILGLDRVTGATRWTWSDDDPRDLAAFRTLTDGEVIAVERLPQDTTGGGQLVALDLDTGGELWDVPLTGSVVAVDGHLVEFTSSGLRGLG